MVIRNRASSFPAFATANKNSQINCWYHLPTTCSIRSHLVWNHALWRYAPFLRWAYQQSLGSLGAAELRDHLIKDVSILIDGSPKPILLTNVADDDFIQLPDIIWAMTFSLPPMGIVRAEFQFSSSKNLLITRNRAPTLFAPKRVLLLFSTLDTIFNEDFEVH